MNDVHLQATSSLNHVDLEDLHENTTNVLSICLFIE